MSQVKLYKRNRKLFVLQNLREHLCILFMVIHVNRVKCDALHIFFLCTLWVLDAIPGKFAVDACSIKINTVKSPFKIHLKLVINCRSRVLKIQSLKWLLMKMIPNKIIFCRTNLKKLQLPNFIRFFK